MKQITMQEAMRAVADGKTVGFEHPNGSNGIIEITQEFSAIFHYSAKYLIKETIKVAIFEVPFHGGTTFEPYRDTNPPHKGKRVSEWIEMEVNK